ncbi:insulin-induced gene 2 protein isoform X3 [Echeneis naucrates]|uniref:insulin-induced gene 2 protein isoform X3 n=1 Tax=Echeneis naucrates TaxID=173247 RepID=UPI001113E9BD|nr:insulin-induced gene 2 protein isoform X3 [Echeneis naucrates]
MSPFFHQMSLAVSSPQPAMIGLLYPCIDGHLGEPHKFKREWSSVMRCVAVFVGINHASAVSFLRSLHFHLSQKGQVSKVKIVKLCKYCLEPLAPDNLVLDPTSQKVDFANNIQLSLTLAALSIGLWWTFDRSRSGFGLGVGIALLATLATQLLVYNGVFKYTSPDFLYIRSWLPCIFFAGVITMGNIGRQLALYEYKFIQEKTHQD